MEQSLILQPILAHILLVTILFFMLLVRKKTAVREGNVDLSKTALNNQAWPAEVLKVSNNIANQFETPVLFYGVCIVLAVSSGATMLSVYLAWTWVALRFVHSYVHTGSNYVPHRMKLFAGSLIVILALAVQAALHLAS